MRAVRRPACPRLTGVAQRENLPERRGERKRAVRSTSRCLHNSALILHSLQASRCCTLARTFVLDLEFSVESEFSEGRQRIPSFVLKRKSDQH